MTRQVFVSSTYEDLARHRIAAEEAIRQLNMRLIDVTETSERMADRVDSSLQALYKADVFVGIYATRYGDVLAGYEISLTELLYQEALRLNIPRYVYVVDPREEWATEFLHTDYRGAMMRMFLDFLKNNNHLRYFTRPDDLADKILFDLARFKADKNSL